MSNNTILYLDIILCFYLTYNENTQKRRKYIHIGIITLLCVCVGGGGGRDGGGGLVLCKRQTLYLSL